MLTKVFPLLLAFAVFAGPAVNSAGGFGLICPIWLKQCGGSADGSQVDVTADGIDDGAGGADGDSDDGLTDAERESERIKRVAAERAAECAAGNQISCRGNYTVEILAFPDVSVDDLASFRPTPPALSGDPAGFGVAELPANIYASATTEEQTGDLLGYPVTVRFTPTSFDFTYGDGTSVRTLTGGASWTSLGQAQFTPTPTTHTYRERGTYAVSVTVNYTPAVNFGSGWKPVPGTIAATGPGYSIRILEARTALVRYTCNERPTAPGC